MGGKYERAETVIMELEVRNQAGTLVNPSTSTKVLVTDPAGTIVVGAGTPPSLPTDMDNDGAGKFHKDYTPAADAVLGFYTIRYTTVDGGRTNILDDGFDVEE